MSIKQHRTINKEQVIRHLNRIFASATQGMGKASRNIVTKDYRRDKDGYGVATELRYPRLEKTESYDLQVDFCYFVNKIQFGPDYVVSKIIADCNQFIDDIITKRKRA